MTIAGALTMTGAIFAFAGVILAITADFADKRARRRLTPIAWAAFVLAVGCLIAAAWTAALT